MESNLEHRTADSVMEKMSEMARDRNPITPGLWVESAEFLNVLRGDEDNKLAKLHQEVAEQKVAYLEEGKSAVEAKTRVEAGDTYYLYLKQKAKIEKITEHIRLAKVRARSANDEMRGY